MTPLMPALKVLGTAALVGFGATALVRATQRSLKSGAPSSLPAAPDSVHPTLSCLTEVWSPLGRMDAGAVEGLSMSAVLSVAQFPGVHLTPASQRDAMDALREYFAEVEEFDEDDYVRISFPGVVGSMIPEDGSEVGVQSALERLENYRRFGAAAAVAVLAPECAWPEPFSQDLPEDLQAQQVWRSLEHLAVVALSDRDQAQLRVDIDPIATVLDDRLEACIGEEFMHELRSPTSLSPKLGDNPDDVSWQLTHQAQEQLYEALSAALSNPDTTAPVTMAVMSVAPRCPWGDKQRYGLRMTTMWHEAKRLEDLAYDDLRGEATP